MAATPLESRIALPPDDQDLPQATSKCLLLVVRTPCDHVAVAPVMTGSGLTEGQPASLTPLSGQDPDTWPLSPSRQDLGSPRTALAQQSVAQITLAPTQFKPSTSLLGEDVHRVGGLSICSPNYSDITVLKALISICVTVLLLVIKTPLEDNYVCHDGPQWS